MRVSIHKSASIATSCSERKFQLVSVWLDAVTETARAGRTSEKPRISRHGDIARNTEVLPLQEGVENADDVRLRVYDTERLLLYSRARDTLRVSTLSRPVRFMQVFGRLS